MDTSKRGVKMKEYIQKLESMGYEMEISNRFPVGKHHWNVNLYKNGKSVKYFSAETPETCLLCASEMVNKKMRKQYGHV